MWNALDDALGRLAARWIDFVRQRARAVAVVFAVLALGALGHAALHLGLNSKEDDLFSADLPFAGLRRDFYVAFPRLVDPVVVVLDADTRDLADRARDRLADRLRADPAHFAHVFEPGGGAFFERNGLLYLDEEDLHDLVDNLAGAQPYLAELARDPSLRGLASILREAVRHAGAEDFPEADLAEVLGRVADGVEAALAGERYSLSWADLVLGEDATRQDRRRYLVIQPVVDFAQVNPAESALLALRGAVDELGYRDGGVRARATGLYALAYEEMEHVSQQTSLAGLAAFALVTGILWLALRSLRFVAAALATLVAGLCLTAGFASLAIGHLNLISVAFAVLFIGLSIDFAIHLCLRYREVLAQGAAPEAALRETARRVGSALAVCAATTAIGFYAFVPTDYAGVAELGLIAGTGMLISLVANLTLLPALLYWWTPADAPPQPTELPAWTRRARATPIRYAPWVAGATALLAVGAGVLCARLRFDPNPLHLRDPSAPSVQAFEEMLAHGEAFPWNVNVLARDAADADAAAARLEALPQVDHTVSLSDFLPGDQPAKLAILEDAALLLGPALDERPSGPPPSDAERAVALGALGDALRRLDPAQVSPALAGAAGRLASDLGRFLDGADARALAGLEQSLVGSLPDRLRLLRESLRAEPIEREDLPRDLVERLVASDGRVRVEVFPKGDLNDSGALESYVEAVRGVAPDAFGEGVAILESGRAVMDALRQALLTASVCIFALLLALWRQPVAALLVAAPLGLAALFTGATAVLSGIPLNFANVIVIPLLLGMGVDSAIHLLLRFAEGKPEDRNVLRTSTARAVLYSSLTTIASFGTLGLSSHLGMASLGRLLTIGIGATLVCSLAVLPALLTLAGGRGRGLR